MDSIAIGVLVACLEHRGSLEALMRASIVRIVIIFLSGLLMSVALLVRDPFFKETFRYSFEGISTALFIGFAITSANQRPFEVLFLRVARTSFFRLTALASYSIYLVHLPVIYLFWSCWGKTSAISTVAALFSLLAGVLVWRLVEVPSLSLRNRLLARIGSRQVLKNE